MEHQNKYIYILFLNLLNKKRFNWIHIIIIIILRTKTVLNIIRILFLFILLGFSPKNHTAKYKPCHIFPIGFRLRPNILLTTIVLSLSFGLPQIIFPIGFSLIARLTYFLNVPLAISLTLYWAFETEF